MSGAQILCLGGIPQPPFFLPFRRLIPPLRFPAYPDRKDQVFPLYFWWWQSRRDHGGIAGHGDLSTSG